MMPQEEQGIQVSHAELLDAFQEMHAAQYRTDFSTIVQLRAGLRKAEQIIAGLRDDRATFTHEMGEEQAHINRQLADANAEVEKLRKALGTADARIAKLEENLPTADSRPTFEDDPITH